MLLKIKTIGKKFEFDVDYVGSILSFNRVFEKFGVNGIAYVSFMADCDNELYCYLDTDVRDMKARAITALTVEQSKDKFIIEAIKEYAVIQSKNPYTKLKKTIDLAINKISDHMQKKATASKKLDDADITSLMKMITQSPEILRSRDEMTKLGESEQNKIGRTKGGKELSRAEERLRGSQ